MSTSPPNHWLIIPAAGVGSRMQMDRPKQYLQIANKTILEHTLACFSGHSLFKRLLLGVTPEDRFIKTLELKEAFPALSLFEGGGERAETVLNGLHSLADVANDEDWVWVHDAARPCLSNDDIVRLREHLDTEPCGLVLAVPVADTLKRIKHESNDRGSIVTVAQTVDRSHLWRAMTPQIFRYGALKAALSECRAKGLKVTDESSAIELAGGVPRLIQGSEQNIKVTLASDLPRVEAYLKSSEINKRKHAMQYPKIGTGFDVHAFGEGEFITLGGVKIPYERGLIAHSDGDVLLHALMDAMLGALALGDIGKHFPDTDAEWKGADSRELLRQVNGLIQAKGYTVGNLDSTIMAQAPKMAPFIEQMQTNIAEDLSLNRECVSIKATTTERLGFTGRKEGIACQVNVLLIPQNFN